MSTRVGELSAADLGNALLAVTEKAKVGVVVGAKRGAIFLSDAAVALFGHPREVLVECDLLELFAAEERARIGAVMDRVARGEAAGPSFQSVIVRADGRRVPVDVTVVPVMHHGRVHTASFLADASEHAAAETNAVTRELEALKKILVEGHLDPAVRDEALARLEEVAAGTNRVAAIARDLRAPPRPPAAAHTARLAAVPAGAPRPRSGRPRVLIVDDEPAIGRSLRALLDNEHEIAVATTGADALRRLLGEETFDAVLCDLTLGDLSGMEVYERLAKAHPGQERRMVFMTGGATTEDAEAFLARVPNERLEKPFELTALVHALRNVLSS